jgi:hypothetical protein
MMNTGVDTGAMDKPFYNSEDILQVINYDGLEDKSSTAEKANDTDKRIAAVLSKMEIVYSVDSTDNSRITDWLSAHKHPYREMEFDTCSYTYYMPEAAPDFGIKAPQIFNTQIVIKRMRSLDELAPSLLYGSQWLGKDLKRATESGCKFILLVEQPGGWGDIAAHYYSADTEARHFTDSLLKLQARFSFNTLFTPPQLSAPLIYWQCYYSLQDILNRTL